MDKIVLRRKTWATILDESVEEDEEQLHIAEEEESM